MDQHSINTALIGDHFQKVLHQGASYCDCRFFSRDIRECLLLDNGNLEANDTSLHTGIGVRVLYGGAWGFAASSTVSALPECFGTALLNAQAAARLGTTPFGLAGGHPAPGANYSSPVHLEPSQVSLKEKLDFLYGFDARLKRDWLQRRIVRIKCREKKIHFWNTEGVERERTLTNVFGFFTVMAVDKQGHMQQRSHTLYTTGRGTRGWELITEAALFEDHIERVTDELRQVLSADDLDYGIRSLILLPGQSHLQVHETIGHPLELDRILGYELSYAGGSFVTLDDFGTLRYGSPKLTVSVFDDLENSPGTFGFDDEGTPQHTYLLIDRGILVNALSSRSSIAAANRQAGRTIFGGSGATARANAFYRSPIERMSNLNILPGTDGSLDDIIAGTENGVVMDNPVSWSISANRDHFHFGCEMAWEVKDGKKTRVLKNPTYQGHTLELYKNLCAVGDSSTWRVEQVENCGKGEPNQEIELGHGVPVLKFDAVQSGERR